MTETSLLVFIDLDLAHNTTKRGSYHRDELDIQKQRFLKEVRGKKSRQDELSF